MKSAHHPLSANVREGTEGLVRERKLIALLSIIYELIGINRYFITTPIFQMNEIRHFAFVSVISIILND